MTSYLLISKDASSTKEAIKTICDENAIHILDQSTITKPSEAKSDAARKTAKSIGIEDIKKIRQQIFLKPFKGKVKAIIIEDGESLTIEAQNALLKVLEEPPEHTIIIIASKSKDAILPTIQSRCTIREYGVINDEKDEDTAKLIATIETLTSNEALELAESLDRKKEQLQERLEKIIITLHDRMITTDAEKQLRMARMIKILQNAHTIITTSNANTRLTLEAKLLLLAS